jgi:hypothetical protein
MACERNPLVNNIPLEMCLAPFEAQVYGGCVVVRPSASQVMYMLYIFISSEAGTYRDPVELSGNAISEKELRHSVDTL